MPCPIIDHDAPTLARDGRYVPAWLRAVLRRRAPEPGRAGESTVLVPAAAIVTRGDKDVAQAQALLA